MSLIAIENDIVLPDRSLKFGAATSDVCEVTPVSPSPFPSGTFTVMALINPTTATIRKTLFNMNGTGGLSWVLQRDSVVASRWVAVVNRTTDSITSTDDFTFNEWQWICLTYDEGATQGIELFRGNLKSSIRKCNYVSVTNGSGAAAPADGTLAMFNRQAYDRAFEGLCSAVRFFDWVLSINEMNAAAVQLDRAGGIGKWFLGDNGTGTQWDLSGNGNNGTVTGATADFGPALEYPRKRKLVRTI